MPREHNSPPSITEPQSQHEHDSNHILNPNLIAASESDSDSEAETSSASESSSERVERHLKLSHERWRDLSEGRVRGVLNALEKIDRLLIWVDRLLYYTQPPATGRIRVVWEKDPSDGKRYFPVMVKWIKVKGGRWRYTRLINPVKAVHGRGGFATYREEVIRLVQIATRLIKDRKVLISYLARLGQGWTQKSRFLSEQELDLIEEMLLVIDKINKKGKIKIETNEVMR